jgi:hypothetical protein
MAKYNANEIGIDYILMLPGHSMASNKFEISRKE